MDRAQLEQEAEDRQTLMYYLREKLDDVLTLKSSRASERSMISEIKGDF
jgi:hypothetical protein